MPVSILSGKKEVDVTEISYIHSIWRVAPKKIFPKIETEQGIQTSVGRFRPCFFHFFGVFWVQPKKIFSHIHKRRRAPSLDASHLQTESQYLDSGFIPYFIGFPHNNAVTIWGKVGILMCSACCSPISKYLITNPVKDHLGWYLQLLNQHFTIFRAFLLNIENVLNQSRLMSCFANSHNTSVSKEHSSDWMPVIIYSIIAQILKSGFYASMVPAFITDHDLEDFRGFKAHPVWTFVYIQMLPCLHWKIHPRRC